MLLPFDLTIKATWLGFLGYWLWSSRQVKSVQRREPWLVRFGKYWLPLFVAGALLGPGEWYGDSWLQWRFLPKAIWLQALGAALTVVGVLLACWARHVLGRNWSVAVQLKQEHELIERGPYRRVRHPIYSGVLLGFVGTALAIGEWRGLLALAILFASFWIKLRIEERWLAEHFGAKYRAYQQRTAALIPGVL